MPNKEERIQVYAYNECLKNPEYRSCLSKIREVEKQIGEACGNLSLVRELEELISLTTSIHLEYAYLAGFKDGKMCLKCAQSA